MNTFLPQIQSVIHSPSIYGEMEYFDFEGASHGSHGQEDDVASDHIELDENEAIDNFDSLLEDQPLEFPNDPPEQEVAENQVPDVVDPVIEAGMFPMFRAKESCDFCRRMGFDCFVARRGVMQNGCTCCISLYRECSFTHTKTPGKFLDTLHTVSENVDIPTGGLTGKRALKSLTGVAAPEDAEARGKKSSARLSREAVRILKTWLLEHRQYPYPNEQEKEELQERTGLNRTQITNWLANSRRRGKVRSSTRSASPFQGGIDIPGQESNISLMTPMERWKHSPPENEPAATSDILRALMTVPFDPSRPRQSQPGGHVRSLSRTGSSNNDSSHANSSRHEPTSASSRETSGSSMSDFSFASAFSHRSSLGSLGSFGSKDRKDRRRRRRPSTPVNTFTQQRARSARVFQCTFCTESFPTKYDWQRHEKSLHIPLEKWTCSPEGGAVLIDGSRRCVFCMVPDPDKYHLESHDFSSCQEKLPHERSFYRKDHLNQHLRLMHHVKFHSSMENWRSTTTELKSRCGFCGTSFVTWKDRVDHLAAHFKNGADMSHWQGDWGFEPFVLGLVENAMPPYLIGQEKITVNPYKPSHTLAPTTESKFNGFSTGLDVIFDDTNSYQRLQQSLMAYIHDQLAAGIIPTDHMLQDEGRRTIYGTDDPWNQTCADNPVWLSVLKRDAGLEMIPDSDHVQFSNLGMQPPFAAQGGLRQPPMETNPLARTVCHPNLHSPGIPSSSGVQSPAPRTGRSSAATSGPGSFSGSYGGSAGVVPTAPHSALSTDWGDSRSGNVSSFSTPVSGPVDPFVQMGFDPDFLKRLHNGYDELQGEMEGLCFDGLEGEGGAPMPLMENMPESSSLPVSNTMAVPISIPSPKQPAVPVPEASRGDSLYYSGMNRQE